MLITDVNWEDVIDRYQGGDKNICIIDGMYFELGEVNDHVQSLPYRVVFKNGSEVETLHLWTGPAVPEEWRKFLPDNVKALHVRHLTKAEKKRKKKLDKARKAG